MCPHWHCRWRKETKKDANVRQLMQLNKKRFWRFWPRYVVTCSCVCACVNLFCFQILTVEFISCNRLLVCKILKIEQLRYAQFLDISNSQLGGEPELRCDSEYLRNLVCCDRISLRQRFSFTIYQMWSCAASWANWRSRTVMPWQQHMRSSTNCCPKQSSGDCWCWLMTMRSWMMFVVSFLRTTHLCQKLWSTMWALLRAASFLRGQMYFLLPCQKHKKLWFCGPHFSQVDCLSQAHRFLLNCAFAVAPI